MKKQKGRVLKRMMAVFLSAVLAMGMVQGNVSFSVLAMEGTELSGESGTPASASGNDAETGEGEQKPGEKSGEGTENSGGGVSGEGTETPGEDTGTPGKGTETPGEGTGTPGEGAETPGKEGQGGVTVPKPDEKEPGTVSGNDAEEGTVSGNDAKPPMVMRMAAPAAQADNIAYGTGWTLDADGKLTISSDAGMENWCSKRDTVSSVHPNQEAVKTVEIQGGVTSIKYKAFCACSNLTSIEIPDGVTSIEGYAFFRCSSLTSVTIPGSVESIGGYYAFSECSSLESVTISEGMKSIGDAAFSDCSSLTSIEIPDSVTSIEYCAFSGCSKLENITMSNGVTNIVRSAFSYCSSLKSITIPEGVTSIENKVFFKCSSLKSITIPEGVTSIGESAFYQCSSLTGITIPEGVTSIGKMAFYECSSLTDVTVKGKTPSTLGDSVFKYCKFVTDGDDKTGIRVPSDVVQTYKTAWTDWKDYIIGDAAPAEPHIHDGVTFTPWEKTDSLPTDPGNYYLTENVDLTNTWRLESVAITLCLNGNTINVVNKNNVIQIMWSSSAALDLYDCQNAGKITGGKQHAVAVWQSGTFNMHGGEISGGSRTGSGGTVYVMGSTFNMYGGKISGNTTTGGGSGVYIINENSTFNMYGGEISGNTAAYGGGVYVDPNSTFHMTGGVIANNAATTGDGGGVNVDGKITVGGTAKITGNTKGGAADNVYLHKNKTITIDTDTPLTGSAQIGVTSQIAPTDGNPVAVTSHSKGDYSSYFTSDNTAYQIINDSNTVKLMLPHSYGSAWEKDASGHWHECSGCGAKKDQAGHTYDDDADTDCNVCGYQRTVHTHVLTRVEAKSATCTEDGNTAYYVCGGENGCNKWFSDAEGAQEITDKSSVVVSKTGHSYDTSTWGYQAADGHAHVCSKCNGHDTVSAHTAGAAATEMTPQTCTVCGYIIAPATGHICSPQPVEKKEPNCTTAGRQAYYHCEGCGRNYEDAEGKKIIEDISAWGIIDPLGHDWGEWKVTKPATTAQPGEKERICKRCNEKETETIPKKSGGSGGDQGGGSGGTGDGSGDDNGGAGGDNPGGGTGGDQGGSGSETPGGNSGSPGGNQSDGSGTGQPKVKQEKKGNIQKEVRVEGDATLDAAMATPLSELADMVLTEEEKQQAAAGTDIRIVLEVKDARAAVSPADRKAAEAAVRGGAAKGYVMGQYLDISLYKVVGSSRSAIKETSGKITVAIQVPDSLKNTDAKKMRTFAVVRVHDGKTELLTDLDNEEDTVTIETDRFSTYAIVYQDTEGGAVRISVENGSNRQPGTGKDDEPKTGDVTPIELCATLSMIAGMTYLLLYFADRRRGMTEETKKELVSRLTGWGKRGGKIRRYLALAAIFVLLVYYHSIGKKTCVEWEEIYGE